MSPACGTFPVFRAIAASFLAFAAARRCSRVRVGLSTSSSSSDDSSDESSSSEEDAFGSFSTTSFPSASRGRRFLEKCFPPSNTLVRCSHWIALRRPTSTSKLLEFAASATSSPWGSSWCHYVLLLVVSKVGFCWIWIITKDWWVYSQYRGRMRIYARKLYDLYDFSKQTVL